MKDDGEEFKMIVNMKASCHLSGDSFSPRAIEQITDLQLSRKKEVGDIQTTGPHIGDPIKYGMASLYPPKGLTTKIDNCYYELEWVVNILMPHIKTLQSKGVEEIYLDISVYYKGQCILAFQPNLLRQIAYLNIPFWITCYEDYDEECN